MYQMSLALLGVQGIRYADWLENQGSSPDLGTESHANQTPFGGIILSEGK